MIAGDDLRLGLGQVERRPVHLGDVGDQQDDERDHAGGENRNQPYSSCLLKIVTRLRLPAQRTTGTVDRTCGTSYETSCATDRIAPSRAYLFRLDQPARKIPIADKLDTATR